MINVKVYQEIFAEASRKGYDITNVRIMGDPKCTSEGVKIKDIIQEAALLQYWLRDKHRIIICPETHTSGKWGIAFWEWSKERELWERTFTNIAHQSYLAVKMQGLAFGISRLKYSKKQEVEDVLV